MYICVVCWVYTFMICCGTVCTPVMLWYSMYTSHVVVQYVHQSCCGTVCTPVMLWYSMYTSRVVVQYVHQSCCGTVCTPVMLWYSMYTIATYAVILYIGVLLQCCVYQSYCNTPICMYGDQLSPFPVVTGVHVHWISSFFSVLSQTS